MDMIIKIASASLLFFLFIGVNYAFQKPDLQHQKMPQALVLEKKQAEVLLGDGLWNEAIQAYQNLQEKCKSQGLEKIAIDLYEDILAVIILREDIDFETQLQQIKQFKTNEDHPNFEGIYFGALAHLYTFYGELDSLNKYYKLAVKSYSNKKRYRLEANLNINLAYEFVLVDDLQTAKKFIEKAEKILHTELIPNNIDLPIIYNVQSIIYDGLGEYEKALKSTLTSINHLESSPNPYPLDLVYEYNNLASIYSSTTDYSNSLFYYQKALNIIEEAGDYPINESASLIYNIGATYVKQGKYDQAKKAFIKSLHYLDQTKEINSDILADYVNNYHQLVDCYQNNTNLDSALFYIQAAEKINEKFIYRISTTYIKHSRILIVKKEFDSAQFYASKAVETALEAYGPKNEFISSAYKRLSDISSEKEELPKALVFLQKALESISIDFSAKKEVVGNPTLENILFKGELLTILARKLPLLKELYKEPNSTITPEDIFATAKLATEALEHMNKGMKDVDSKRFWLNTKAIPLFESAIEIAIDIANKTGDESYKNEAFMLSERSKSMLMTDAMQEAIAGSFGGVPDDLIEESQSLQKALADAEKSRFDARMAGDAAGEKLQDSLIFEYKKASDVLKHTFETKYPKYFELKYASKIASIQEVQDALDNETTFIEYFEGKNKIYAFSINKKATHIETIEKAANYQTVLYDFQNSLTDIRSFAKKPVVVYNNFVTEAHRLYTQLLEASLKEHPKRLIIVPDGQLGYLPFEVLLSQKVPTEKQGTKGLSFAKLPYIIRDYRVSYNYSATLLLSQQANQHKILNGNVLALAPSYAVKEVPEWRGEREKTLRGHLIELPGAEAEVNMLKEKFAGDFFIGTEANEAVFKNKAAEYGILHLAMHGLVDHKNPEFSGLALTEDNSRDEDNFLYAYEIKQLGLNAGLVVLSACETGIGKYQRGEGVVSIGRGFMYAGAPALMMTLWVLNDQAGEAIISEFYNNLSNGMEKDEALRQAKLFFLDNYPPEYTHPFMWAAFVQVGDYSSISIDSKSNWMPYAGGGLAICLLGFFGFKRRSNRQVAA